MYIKKVEVENYGPISSIKYKFPFDNNGAPLPVVLVGKNGVGKTLLLTNILNALIEQKRRFYNTLKEVTENKYYRVGSKKYIKTGCNYSFERYEFTDDASLVSVMVNNYDAFKDTIDEEYKKHININDDRLKQDGFFENCKKGSSNVFENGVFLYFPVERYYIPTWENKSNGQVTYVNDDLAYVGSSNVNIVRYNVLDGIETWILDVIIDKMLYESNYMPMQNEDGTISFVTKFYGKNAHIQSMLNNILSKIFEHQRDEKIRLGVSQKRRLYRTISILREDAKHEPQEIVPSLSNFSSGEMMIFGIMATILREYDRVCPADKFDLDEIEGIVIIDEIDAHLHSNLLKEILPAIIELFPKIQFIVSSHSPIFLMGMQEKFGDNCAFLEMPTGVEVNGVEQFAEVSKYYSIIDENYNQIIESYTKTKEKLMKLTKPLVITEGKTDWKHYENALSKAKIAGRYTHVDVEFLKYDKDMGDAELEKLLKNLAIIPNHTIVIGIFDSDSSYGEKYFGGKLIGNNVFACSIRDTNGYGCGIPVELLYSREDLTKSTVDGRRIYLSDEFTEKSHQLKQDCSVVCHNGTLKDAEHRGIIKIVDKEVYDSDEKSLALSKEQFAKMVYEGQSPFDEVDLSGFDEILNDIEQIIIRENGTMDV